MFRFHLANKQCKHILFGGCHDNGYLTILEQYKHDNETSARITLLETIPAQSGFYTLNLRMTRFPSVFRSEPLERMLYLPSLQARELQHQQPLAPITDSVSSPAVSSKALSIITPESSPPQAKKVPAPTTVKTPASIKTTPPIKVQPTTSKTPPPPSWATAAVTNGIPDKGFTISAGRRSKPTTLRFILYTKNGYRVDQPLPPSSSNDIHNLHALMGKGKLCNEHFLKGKCQSARCNYMHTGRLSAGELNALKHKARKISCPEKIGCEDYACYCGHVCPYEKGGKCTKEPCNFMDVHGIDRVCFFLALFTLDHPTDRSHRHRLSNTTKMARLRSCPPPKG
jgi:hypothetical protein